MTLYMSIGKVAPPSLSGRASGWACIRTGSAPLRRPGFNFRKSTGRKIIAAHAYLLPATSTIGVWAFLNIAAAAGLWSERTRIGRELSGPLVSTLIGLLFSNLGVVGGSNATAVYDTVNKYLLPLAIPLLLFSADLSTVQQPQLLSVVGRRVLRETGRLLLAFAIGAAATMIGTIAAFKVVPLTALGPTDAWKIASALAARHIGGAINYVAVAETLQISPSAQMAGLAADNLLCAVYFTTLFNLARRIPAESEISHASSISSSTSKGERKEGMQVLEAATGIALSTFLCYLGQQFSIAIGYPSASISVITLLTVVAATLFARQLNPFMSSSEGVAYILLQIFFAAVGASGEVRAVINTAPALFVFCFLQISIHLVLVLVIGRAFGFKQKELLLASNANVGGPSTAGGMAAAKGWRSMITPAILVGTAGYATATFAALALGQLVLMGMVV